jgi:ferredoxin-NADP reductase
MKKDNTYLFGKKMQAETEVTQVLPRTRDVISVRFARPEDFDYLPGQYMFITLMNKGGQKTKHFTISSSPTEDFLEVTKRLTGHEFSNALGAVKPGEKVVIRGPYGNFTFQGEHEKVCMLSGGIGITPLRSMIRYSTDKELSTSIILLYSNSHEDDIVFEDDLEIMTRQNPNLRVVNTITRPGPAWKGLTGRIDRNLIVKEVPDYASRIFFTSGPSRMVDAMRALLKDLGLPENQIKQEYFPGYD